LVGGTGGEPGGAAMNCADAKEQAGPPPVNEAVMVPVPVAEGPLKSRIVAVKVATTLFAEVTPGSVQVAPVQSPLHAVNTKPGFALAEHVLVPPWPTGFGVQATLPAPAGFTAVAMAYESRVKFAVTLRAEATPASVQLAPAQSPLQFAK